MNKLRLFFFVFLLIISARNITNAQSSNGGNRSLSDSAESRDEKLAAILDSCNVFDVVASHVNASKEDMDIFSNYYNDTIYNDRVNFFNETLKKLNSSADILKYAVELEDKYVNLYQRLQEIKKEYPSTVAEYSTKRFLKPMGACNPSCSDIGFESGTLTGWNAYYAGNNSTATTMTYTGAVGGACGAVTKAAFDVVINKYHKNSDYQVQITSGAGNDPIAGPLIPVVAPGGGNYSCRLGDTSVGGSRVGIIDQAFTVTAGNTDLNYMYAVIIDKAPAGHTFGQQPHFIVTITDQTTGDTLQCGQYIVTSSLATTGYQTVYYLIPAYGWWDSIYVAPWKSVYVSLQNYIGHCIDIQAIVSDCYPTAIGPHFCYVYFDATCGPHSIVTSTPSTCGSNITLTAPGGGTYMWTGPCVVGSDTGQTITAGCSGTYTVTVTSPDGCKDTLQKAITITSAMSVTSTSKNAGCATTGSATANPTGGTAPYTYKWSNGSTNQSDTGLVAGTYTCVVSSTGGCEDSVIVTITGGGAITATGTNVNEKCFGGNTGSGTVTPKGGTAPYTYSWSSGQTTSSITGLTAGTYTCTIKDAGGCTTTQTITITQPTAITTTTGFTGTLCGSNTGTASVTVGGGSPGYTYLWSNGGTSSNISSLTGGTYSVTVTDKNGCTTIANVTVPSTNGPRDSIVTSTNVICFGGSNGSATVGVKNGTAPYTYSWTGGQTTPTASGLIAGSYTVTVTDNTGCVATANITITQPPQLRDSMVAETNILCFGGNNGTVTAGVKGGTPTYTYSWNTAPVQTNLNATNLVAGNYTLTIIDANGCKDSTKVTITQPTAVTLTGGAFPVTCNGQCNGQATVIPAGGTSPYTYAWSSGSSAGGISSLCAGTYTATVTDLNGCTHDTVMTITQPPALTMTKSSTPAQCSKANGSASVTVAGGTPPYKYLWSSGGSGTNITNVLPGTYCATVTDAENCTDSICVTVGDIPGETVSVTVTNVTCNGGNNGSATATVTGGAGPYSYSWAPSGGTNTTANTLTAGAYTLTVTDNSGCVDTAIAKIAQPTPVIVSTSPDTICIGQTATLTATGSGGTPGYTYLWNSATSGVSYTVNPGVTTSYTVQATDANGCLSPPVTVTVVVRPPLAVVTTAPPGICLGGSVTLTAKGSGGDGNYTYTWNPGGMTGSSVTVSPTTTTTYTVIVNGCGPPATDSVTIVIFPMPVVNLVADTLQGCYPLCVKFNDLSTVTGGGKIVNWLWTFGNGDSSNTQNPTYCYTKAGVFTIGLTVTTNNGCPGSKTVPNYITVYSHPVASFSLAPQPTTMLNPTIYFTDHSTDAYGIKSWLWTFGDATDSVSFAQNPQHTYLDTGYYCANLTVTNIHGCVDSTTQCLEMEPYFVIYVPNAFTPNGDGLNEVFTAKGVGILTFQMWIFDRWGQQIYETNDINRGWDGRVQNGASGQLCQEDTYVWLIEVTDVFHKNHRYIGRVTLIK